MLRLMWILEVTVFVALLSNDVRDVVLPDGTTRPETFLVLLILIVWEDVLKIRKRLGK